MLVLVLGVGDFAEIELGVGGEVGVAVILEIVLKFGTGEIVFAAGDVAQAVGIESVVGTIEPEPVGAPEGAPVAMRASMLCTEFCKSTNC